MSAKCSKANRKQVIYTGCSTCMHEMSPVLLFQMLPLIKKSTDNLLAVLENKATSNEGFDVIK